MRFLPVNVGATLVEVSDLRQALALLASVQQRPVPGVLEVVPAARTLLVRYDPRAISEAALVNDIASRPLDARIEQAGPLVEIGVHYSGEDLQDVADILGITTREVIARHTQVEFVVAFTGFAPGFAYLSADSSGLDVPRRTTPRTRVPAGSVALAGGFTAVYPQESPGGWQLIGFTASRMWDADRSPAALLQPGFRVRFVELDRAPIVGVPAERAEVPVAQEPPASSASALEVRAPGIQALMQDLGREGQAAQGVSVSGAVDHGALKAANRLVGNPCGFAAIEIVDGGCELQSHGESVAAVTGAAGPVTLLTRDGHALELPRWQAFALADGDRLRMGAPVAGVRSYLAVRGGFAVHSVLGSASTDTLSRIGPPPLVAGMRLPIAPTVRGVVGAPETPPVALPTLDMPVELDVVMGPRTDWFTAEAIAHFAAQSWTVTPQSTRIGLRLSGDVPLARSQPAELPSEGTLWGSVQVPPSGQPVLFLADHPLTGGYPVIASVAPHHLGLLGQVPIGARLRFRPIRSFELVEAGCAHS